MSACNTRKPIVKPILSVEDFIINVSTARKCHCVTNHSVNSCTGLFFAGEGSSAIMSTPSPAQKPVDV